ncbi:MAG: hypothetical protein DMG05_05275 [Acidobacteria bacterium]|nr:MAG: hypothetical protein DMG05_05275 [Acidobacteriota bacterium]
MKATSISKVAVFLLVLTSALAPNRLAFSQVTAGAISGVVTDPSGATVPDAVIEATNLGTNRKSSSNTTQVGTYFLGSLPVGQYKVTARQKGFKEFVAQRIIVFTATTTSLDISLQLGEVTQQVTVEAEAAPLIRTSDAEASTVVERKAVIDLPLSLGGAAQIAASGRRQIENFAFLTPGMTGNQNSKFVNGSPNNAQVMIIDGLPHPRSDTPGRMARETPPYEAVEEFKVSTATYQAELGRGFGVMNFTLKSGTNNFHGNAFYFGRNDVLDARGFFATRKPLVRQNNFGFTLGGPIIKDKTFFFGAFEGFLLRGGAPVRGLVTLPTVAFRQGDFSQLIDPTTGQQIPIFDPATTRPDGMGGFVRDQFPGTVIPPGRISPIAARLVGLLPAPDFPGIVNNYVNLSSRPGNDWIWSVKVDHSFTKNHKLSGTYWWINNPVFVYGQGQQLDNFSVQPAHGGGLRFNDDYIIRPNLLNHAAGGYSAFNHLRTRDARHGNQILQIPGIDPDIPGFPRFNVSGAPTMGNTTSQPVDPAISDNFIFSDTLSWMRGRHQVKFGGEYWYQRNIFFDGTGSGGLGGTFSFRNRETSQPNSPAYGVYGNSWASLLLGQVDSASRLVGAYKVRQAMPYLAFFGGDTIQVNPKLTLSLGLRYELAWPQRDLNDLISGLSLTLPNPGAGNRPGAYVFGKDFVLPAIDKTELGPRLGLAWRWNDKTVVRLGYGIAYAQTGAANEAWWYSGGNAFSAGFAGTSSFASTNNGITPAFLLDQGMPPFTGKLPVLDPTIQNGQVADYLGPSGAKQSYLQSWQLDVQRETPGNIVLDIAYVGTKGTHLAANLENLNQVPATYLGLGSLLDEDISSAAAQAAGILPPYPGFTGSVAQALRPFPQYLDIYNSVQPIGNSTYHSMQVKAQKRFSSNLGFLISYTLSKSITDTSLQGSEAASNRSALDTANRRWEKSLAPNDMTHNAVISWVYELPFGKGMKSAAGKLLRGWEINGVARYTSGTPLGIGGGPSLPLFGGGNRPNRVPGAPVRTDASGGQFDPARDSYLNIAAFDQPLPFTFGNVSPYEPNVRGFGFLNEDLGIIKRTYVPKISEAFNVEFRAEFFNIFNRTVFGAPDSDVNDPTSFGKVGGQANTPRNIQFGLKINF